MIYESLILPDHLGRKLSAAVDFSFISDLVRDCYCPDHGRPSWDLLGYSRWCSCNLSTIYPTARHERQD